MKSFGKIVENSEIREAKITAGSEFVLHCTISTVQRMTKFSIENSNLF